MRPSPSCIRTPNVCLGYSMNGNQLRRLVNKAAKAYADQNRVPHYLSCNQTEPTVLFFAGPRPVLATATFSMLHTMSSVAIRNGRGGSTNLTPGGTPCRRNVAQKRWSWTHALARTRC